ncbi:hypothetical protein [Methylobacterium sp. 1030]|uniref:hypothetical protein n=1 Tax=Methylobacterium sp. 1030 TaxID=3156404 RepID=UPI00339795B3
MAKQTIWLDPPLIAQIVAEAGHRGVSEFMRDAAKRELKRRERIRIREAAVAGPPEAETKTASPMPAKP